MNNELNAARGIVLGLVLALPLWVLIIWLISKLLPL